MGCCSSKTNRIDFSMMNFDSSYVRYANIGHSSMRYAGNNYSSADYLHILQQQQL